MPFAQQFQVSRQALGCLESRPMRCPNASNPRRRCFLVALHRCDVARVLMHAIAQDRAEPREVVRTKHPAGRKGVADDAGARIPGGCGPMGPHAAAVGKGCNPSHRTGAPGSETGILTTAHRALPLASQNTNRVACFASRIVVPASRMSLTIGRRCLGQSQHFEEGGNILVSDRESEQEGRRVCTPNRITPSAAGRVGFDFVKQARCHFFPRQGEPKIGALDSRGGSNKHRHDGAGCGKGKASTAHGAISRRTSPSPLAMKIRNAGRA